ncbi:MAG: RNAse G [candidate division TM6 bacterium GW2011_GWF2_32_72]|nr:MAG: RNAse G [candidate division TM6 bacterium GW2011_GWF2_32_72]
MKKILISQNTWQTKIAILRDDLLQNIYFKSHNSINLERSFFKGTISKVLPGIQTAFVDIGQERSGFLHISEVDRISGFTKMEGLDALDEVEEKKVIHHPMDISKIYKEGEEVLVQVSKEPIFEKGAKLTTCFILPGRFIVLMPNIPKIGVSKKIANRDERTRLKELVKSALPKGMGAIIRTTSEGRLEKDISKDIAFLVSTWRSIEKRYKNAKPAEMLYEDIDISFQVVRDNLDEDVESIIVNNKDDLSKIYKFVKNIAPEQAFKVKFYEEPPQLFDHFGVNEQIEQALNKKVALKSGGSLIIESTEAMTVVDVNTGKFIGKKNQEDTILKTNLEAAEETVRQLRLRNIGGLIVIDFIDMGSSSNKQKVFNHLEKTLKERDKFQSVVLKISEFGLVQMTRKRSGKTLIQQLMETCNKCKGLGVVKSIQNISYTVLEQAKSQMGTYKNKEVTISLGKRTFEYITNKEYNSILDLEKKFNNKITLAEQDNLSDSHFIIQLSQ